MELLKSIAIKKSDIGYNGNLFGGQLLFWIDELLYTKSAMLSGSKLMMTKFAEFTFNSPIKEGEIIKIYISDVEIKNSSITYSLKVDKSNDVNALEAKVVFVKVESQLKASKL